MGAGSGRLRPEEFQATEQVERPLQLVILERGIGLLGGRGRRIVGRILSGIRFLALALALEGIPEGGLARPAPVSRTSMRASGTSMSGVTPVDWMERPSGV